MPIEISPVALTEPTTEEQTTKIRNSSRMSVGNVIRDMPVGQKFAIPVFYFHSAMTRANYDELAAAIKAIEIQGVNPVQDIGLLIDGRAYSSVPEGKQINLHVTCHPREDETPAE